MYLHKVQIPIQYSSVCTLFLARVARNATATVDPTFDLYVRYPLLLYNMPYKRITTFSCTLIPIIACIFYILVFVS